MDCVISRDLAKHLDELDYQDGLETAKSRVFGTVVDGLMKGYDSSIEIDKGYEFYFEDAWSNTEVDESIKHGIMDILAAHPSRSINTEMNSVRDSIKNVFEDYVRNILEG